MNLAPCITPAMPGVRMTTARRVVLWLVSTILVALAAYLGIQSYLSPDLLLNFSGSFIC